jgi:hypothetical protein
MVDTLTAPDKQAQNPFVQSPPDSPHEHAALAEACGNLHKPASPPPGKSKQDRPGD